jgi:carboxymethylenebutenolidase
VIPNKPNQHSMDRLKDIKGELLMIWGKQDNHIPEQGRKAVYEKMVEAKLVFTWHEFNGQHAFMRDEGERYDPELAVLGYDLALKLFQRKLA